jgi:hypothetical protein
MPYAVPIFFAYADNSLYAFSMVGKKIEIMRANDRVCVFVEEGKEGRLWRSVVVEGRFEELPDRVGFKRQRDHAWTLLSRYANWWEPGALKPEPFSDPRGPQNVFFRISVEAMSGREAVD